ncbi:MAG TPA: four helix bundle protein [Bacteroidales bacterium]|jgi:four helix bundle protein|nr:four helix bundle protein [Bacteroidales bacterium]HRS18533.1 four helix bundle protein [Bacteroidales bacterium]
MKNNIIKDKSFAFALRIIALYSQLQENKEFVISKQLLRCGTSIGANINEAIAAESRADFIHKMAIASKEARESLYWLELLHASNLKDFDYTLYIKECTEIVKILTNIVKSTKSNQ